MKKLINKPIIILILILLLINFNIFGQEIFIVINEQTKKESIFLIFLKNYGVLLTLTITIIIFLINRCFVTNEKKKDIKKIKNQLIEIKNGILIEIQNTGDTLKEIDENKDKIPKLVCVVPSKYSILLDLMYVSYNEKLDKKNIEYLNDLYYINSNYKTANEHLMKYLSNNNKLDLLIVKTIIKIVEEEIKNLK